MYKLKYLLEQRNLSKINFGNAPKALFNFAYTNGGRAFTVKTIRPSVPNVLTDVVKTISNSNNLGSSSTYGNNHVFIVSNDLKSNANKDVRNVVVIPITKFETLTKTAVDTNGNDQVFPNYNVLDKPLTTIGSSPVIYWTDFEKAMTQFKDWLGDSEELRQAKAKIQDLENKIKNADTKPPADQPEDEEDDEVAVPGGEDPIIEPAAEQEKTLEFMKLSNPAETIILNTAQLQELSDKYVVGFDKDTRYIYQKILESYAKTTVGEINTWQSAVNFLSAGGADGNWGKASKAFLKDLQDANTLVKNGPPLSNGAPRGMETVVWTKDFMTMTIQAIDTKQLPGLEWKWVPKKKNESIIKLKSLIEQIHVDSTLVKKIKKITNVPTSDNIKKKDTIINDPKNKDLKKDDPKKENDSLIRLPNGYLWVNTYTDTSNSPKFSSKILLKTMYSWPALKKLVYGKQIKVRGTKGLKKVNDVYHMYLYDDVSPYWIDASGNVDTGTLNRNHTRWYYPNVKDGRKLTGIIKDVQIIRLPNNRGASYFYIVDGDSDGWIPSNFVSIA